MRVFIIFVLGIIAVNLYAADKVLVAVLSSFAKPEKLGENFRDNDSDTWDDIESHVRFGARLFADRYCPKEIVIKDYDTGESTESTLKAVHQAEKDGAKIIMGFVVSSSILTINKLYPDRKIPIITMMASHEEVGGKMPPTLQMSYDDKLQGKSLARVFTQMPAKERKNPFLLTDMTNPFSVGLSRQFRKKLPPSSVHELEYVTPMKWPPKGWDLNALKTATTIIMTGEGREVLEVVRQLSKFNQSYILVGGDGWYRGNVTQYLPPRGVYIPDSLTLGHWTPRLPDPDSQEFGKKYKAKYKADPGGTAAMAHDGMKTICKVWKEKHNLSFDSFVGVSVPGLTGTIQFNSRGKQDTKTPLLYEFRNGSYHYERF